MKPVQLYLASASPRRRELLAQLGVKVEVVPQDVSEDRLPNEPPENYVSRLALEKARAGLAGLGAKDSRLVLGADTAVVVDNVVMGSR